MERSCVKKEYLPKLWPPEVEFVSTIVPHHSLPEEIASEFETFILGCGCLAESDSSAGASASTGCCTGRESEENQRPCECLSRSACAYTADGFLKAEYITQSTRPAIIECGSLCGCSSLSSPNMGDNDADGISLFLTGVSKEALACSCPNRMVGEAQIEQDRFFAELDFPGALRRVWRSLEVFCTEKKGLGLRCTESVKAGSFVCEYAGEMVSTEEAKKRVDGLGDTYLFIIREQARSVSDGTNAMDSGAQISSESKSCLDKVTSKYEKESGKSAAVLVIKELLPLFKSMIKEIHYLRQHCVGIGEFAVETVKMKADDIEEASKVRSEKLTKAVEENTERQATLEKKMDGAASVSGQVSAAQSKEPEKPEKTKETWRKVVSKKPRPVRGNSAGASGTLKTTLADKVRLSHEPHADSCIQGIPVVSSTEHASIDGYNLGVKKAIEEAGIKVRFVSVYQRKPKDRRGTTFARIGSYREEGQKIFNPDLWPTDVRVRQWAYSDPADSKPKRD